MLVFLLSIPFLCLFEYSVHRWIMHRRQPLIGELFEEHTIRHHGRYYQQFDFEPEAAGRGIALQIDYRYLLIPLALTMAGIWFWRSFQPLGFLLASSLYLTAQNTLHDAMHNPRPQFFSHWRLYRFLCRYHCLHHWHNNMNFNATLPLGLDWLLGTLVRPTAKETEAMRAMGF